MSKRPISLILAMLMLLSVFASCTAKKSGPGITTLGTSNTSDNGTVSSSETDIKDTSTEDNVTTPEQTTPEQTTPEQTTPQQTTPQQTTPQQTTPQQTTPQQTTPQQTTTQKPTTETTLPPTTTKEPEPEPVDDGTRVHSWLSDSYVKNLGTDMKDDNGTVYSFKEWFNVSGSPFTVFKRKHSNGSMTAESYKTNVKLRDHVTTTYGGVARVDGPGPNKFNPLSTPGLLFLTTTKGYDVILSFTAPEDGTYRVRAAAKRVYTCYSDKLFGFINVNGTGSRYFIEAGGKVIVEETDDAKDTLKEIDFKVEVELKKGETVYFGYDPIDGSSNYASNDDEAILNCFNVELIADKDAAKQNTHTVTMAKNELESFQVSVNSNENVNGLSLVMVSSGVQNISVEMLEERLVNVNGEPYPDGLVPINGKFNLKANETKTILVRFATNKNTKAGTYTYKFELRSPSGWVLQTYTVTVTVWAFALPDSPTCDTATGIGKAEIIKFEGQPESKTNEYYKKYYDLLLDYKVNAYYMPYDTPLNSNTLEYMSDPRVKSFQIWTGYSDATLVQIYNKLKQNPVWLEKAYFYPFDEPTTVEHLDELAAHCERLRRLCPEIKIVIPFFVNIDYNGTLDEVDFLSRYVDLWCPKSACWNPGFMADPLNRGYFGDRMANEKAGGDRVWWYVCWEPNYPYCNLYVNEPGVDHRVLFWQQYSFDVDGLLYWSSTHWNYVEDPWADMNTVKWLNDYVYGDGSLLYPGKPVGVDGPCASLRLEIVRDGVEDYDMLLLAEKYLGKAWVDAQIDRITTDVITHTTDNALFAEVRKAIGDALSAKISG